MDISEEPYPEYVFRDVSNGRLRSLCGKAEGQKIFGDAFVFRVRAYVQADHCDAAVCIAAIRILALKAFRVRGGERAGRQISVASIEPSGSGEGAVFCTGIGFECCDVFCQAWYRYGSGCEAVAF